MLSKSEIKDLKALHQKKYRDSYGYFLVEGDKSVREAMRSEAEIEKIFAIGTWDGLAEAKKMNLSCIEINAHQLSQIAELKNPNQVVAKVRMPAAPSGKPDLSAKWHIYLDRLRDPGNMGTILRIADWYGMDAILCSPDCVEIFNQKVIQASMGAIFRVRAIPIASETLISLAQEAGTPLHAAVLDGDSIYDKKATPAGILMMGNEAQGLSEELIDAANHLISIPGKGKAESLNVAIATGILTDWIHR